MVHIRAATLDDARAINDIYNDAIKNTNATFDTQPKPLFFSRTVARGAPIEPSPR
jgi:L-amino acid N-acyltransferase YncA